MLSKRARNGAPIEVSMHPDVDKVVLGAPPDTLAELLHMSHWTMRYMAEHAQEMTEQFTRFRECEDASHVSWRSAGFGKHNTFVYSQWLAGFATSFTHYDDKQWTRERVEEKYKNKCFNPFGIDANHNRKLSFLHGCFFAMHNLQTMLGKYEWSIGRRPVGT
ncbi:hypothetical protein AB1Y20_008539 [Prymnesium parvum]|uniref:Uncharacterized protein n=1 Tax=Prymnesium parvum TaxID=97485 RepID=A0AB34ITT9_PRYPA